MSFLSLFTLGGQGGWNNIRMSMESTMVFAYATDRILVMPPKQQFYLVGKTGSKNYDDFFHFDDDDFRKRITIITMEEFLAEHGGGPAADAALKVSIEDYANAHGVSPTKLASSGRECGKRRKGTIGECDTLYGYLREAAYVLPYHGSKDCVVFGEGEIDEESKQVRESEGGGDLSKIFGGLTSNSLSITISLSLSFSLSLSLSRSGVW